MAIDEGAQALLRIANGGKAFISARQQCHEGVLLDQVEQLFLALEVVIQPGQAGSRFTRDVADGSGVVALLAEDASSGGEYGGEAAVGVHRSNVRSNCPTKRIAPSRASRRLFN